MVKNSSPQDPQFDECAREPIRIPGCIQEHGLLFSLKTGDLIIEQISENTQKIIGRKATDLLGTNFLDLLTPDTCEASEKLIHEASTNYVNPFLIVIKNGEKRIEFNGIAHSLQEGITILELELLEQTCETRESLDNYFQLIQKSLQSSVVIENPVEVADLMAREVKRFTGYDRVMVYRFAEDFHGEIIAEAKEEEMEPYLNLHYPASDIPPQARELYLKNWVRLLQSVDAKQAMIVPQIHPRSGKQLDLGHSVLRSISPIHIQYLKNMDVASTLTISLVINGKLWGLIACHHRSPRFVSYGIRATASLYGVIMSAQLAKIQTASEEKMEAESRIRVMKVVSNISLTDNLSKSLLKNLPDLYKIFDADGAAYINGDHLHANGDTPSDELIIKARQELSDKYPDRIFVTDRVKSELPAMADASPRAAGMIAIALGRDTWLMIFRNETIHTVRWGGDPDQAKHRDKSGKLSPRNSFSEWKETIRQRSLPWPRWAPNIADELRSSLAGFLISQNKILEQGIEDQRHFASIIAHEVKSQIQPPLLALGIVKEHLPDTTNNKVASTIDIGVESLTNLSNFTQEMMNFANVDSNDFIEEEIDMVMIAKQAAEQARIATDTENVTIQVNPLPSTRGSKHQVYHLMSNLIRNSLIHARDELQPDFRIEVGCKGQTEAPIYYVKDNGRGIPKDQHKLIFDYFYRYQGSSKTPGSGIGLSFIRQILDKRGGKIWLDSDLGKGTTFYFTH